MSAKARPAPRCLHLRAQSVPAPQQNSRASKHRRTWLVWWYIGGWGLRIWRPRGQGGPDAGPHQAHYGKDPEYRGPAKGTYERGADQEPDGTAHVQSPKHGGHCLRPLSPAQRSCVLSSELVCAQAGPQRTAHSGMSLAMTFVAEDGASPSPRPTCSMPALSATATSQYGCSARCRGHTKALVAHKASRLKCAAVGAARVPTDHSSTPARRMLAPPNLENFPCQVKPARWRLVSDRATKQHLVDSMPAGICVAV